eukprot:TRINITY_DN67305_c3_g2_i1.p1 TRINITY_DN67305_c3_g2~~TRINITY_DN67305_c3_g2_i1.p1  ORF type:complete len:1061 (+),score=324.79 TRINITY_DN67305_c3_g2_i1:69-3251(+)
MSYKVNWDLKKGDWRMVWVMEEEHYFGLKPQEEFEKYDKIIENVKEGQWEDPVEISQASAPTADGGKITPELVRPKDIPVWKDITTKLYKREPGEKSVHWSDVCQGQLGNCWFMAGLAAVAKLGRVSELIARHDEEKGVYEVKLWRYDVDTKTMKPLRVCVDNRIPLAKGVQERPFYCYSDDQGELWPSIVEKAFAKAIKERNGKAGYEALCGGMTQIAVAHLLGGVAKVYKSLENGTAPFNVAMLSNDWLARVAYGHILGVSFRKAGDEAVGPEGEPGGSNGLVAGHAYTVLDIKQCPLDESESDFVYLAQLRNPWGEMGATNPNLEWKGQWSDTSDMWEKHPTVKACCSWEGGAKDGVFWMSMEDVAEQAHRIQVAVPWGAIPLEDDYREESTDTSSTSGGGGGQWVCLGDGSMEDIKWPGRRSGVAMVDDGENRIFTFGGCGEGPSGDDREVSWEHFNDVWVYDIGSGLWKCWAKNIPDSVQTSTGPPPAMGAGGVIYGGYLYVFGGYALKKCYDQLWKMPIAEGTEEDDRKWTKVAPVGSIRGGPSKRNNFGMTLLHDGKKKINKTDDHKDNNNDNDNDKDEDKDKEKEEEKEKAHAKKKAEQLEKQNAEQKKKAEELQKQQEKAKHEEEVKTAKQKAEEAKKESARKEEEEEKQNEEKAKKQQEKVKLEQHEKQIADGKAKAKQEELQKKINEDNMKKKAKADAIRAERTSKRRERHHKHELHHKAVVRRHQAHLAEQRRKAANRVHFLRGWRHYGGSYRRVEAKRYGPFCILSGLARRGAYRGPIMRLPTWCRPVRQTMHAVFAAGGRNERFDITSSGVVYWQYGLGHSSWTPMDSMMFTIRGQRMHNLYLHGHYHNYGGAYERAKWTKYGDWCQLTGLIRARSPIVHNRYLARVPPACYPHARLIFDAQHHYESVRVDLLPNGWIVAVNVQRSHGVRWISLNNIGYFTNRGHNLHMVHGWHPYHHSYRSPAWKRQGNFCAVSGLMRGNHWGGVMFVLPAQCRPNRRLIFMCNNHGGRYPNVRLDVLRDGRVVRAGGGHSHGWISLNAIRFLRR